MSYFLTSIDWSVSEKEATMLEEFSEGEDVQEDKFAARESGQLPW